MARTVLFKIVLLLFLGLQNMNQGSELPRVDSPQPGEQLHGQVIISGNTAISAFARTEIYFGYSGTNDWFLIGISDQPVRNGPIATWDTTSITDGKYQIKVVVFLIDGSYAEVVVPDLTVSNRFAEITQTLGNPTSALDLLSGKEILARTLPIITATPLPDNPASVRESALGLTIAGTAGCVIVCFLLWIGLKSLFSGREG
jgi:hypothetical protein